METAINLNITLPTQPAPDYLLELLQKLDKVFGERRVYVSVYVQS